MFPNVFSSDNPFWQGMSRIADLIWLNVLFLVASLPLVTAGAALTALYDTAWRLHAERGAGVAPMFFRSFRSNFAKSTALWAVVAPLGLSILAWWLLLPPGQVLVLRVFLTLLYLLVFPYFFHLQARFENTVPNTLRNAVLIPIARIPHAAGVAVVTAIFIALIAATAIHLPATLPPLLLGGFGFVAYAQIPLLNESIKPWSEPEDSRAS